MLRVRSMEETMRFYLLSRVAVALFVGVLISGAVRAADTPPTLAQAKLVAASDVVKAQSTGVTVIDTRIASEYRRPYQGRDQRPLPGEEREGGRLRRRPGRIQSRQATGRQGSGDRHVLQRAGVLEEFQGVDGGD